MSEAVSHPERAEEPTTPAPGAGEEHEVLLLTWWQRFSFGALETALWGMRGVLGLRGAVRLRALLRHGGVAHQLQTPRPLRAGARRSAGPAGDRQGAPALRA